MLFIIGSEFHYDMGSPSYNRILNLQSGFEQYNCNVVVILLNTGFNIGLKRSISLFKKKNLFYCLYRWVMLLFRIKKQYPKSILFLSDLHNRYALVFYLFNFLFKVKIIDIVESPEAQFNEFKENKFFNPLKPGHQYHKFRAFFRMYFYYLLYWKIFKIRLAINEELEFLIKEKVKGKDTIVCPIIFSKNKMNNFSNNKVKFEYEYYLHIGSNSITKDGLDVLVEGYLQFVNMSQTKNKLILTGNFQLNVKSYLDKIIHKYNLADSIIFVGFINNERLSNLISFAKALLITKKNNQLNRYNFSTRLIDYLQSERPIIMPDYGVFNKYFSDKETAFFFESDSVKSFANTLLKTDSLSEDLLCAVGKKAKKLLFNEFSAELYCGKIMRKLTMSEA